MSGDRMGDTRFGMISKKTTQFLYSFFHGRSLFMAY